MSKGEYSFAAEFSACLPKKEIRRGKQRGNSAGGDAQQQQKQQKQEMGATISTYPPLGQVTQLASGDSVMFYVMLETKRSDGSDGDARDDGRDTADAWQVAVWYTTSSSAEDEEEDRDGEWTEVMLAPVGDGGTSSSKREWLSLQDVDPSMVRHCYCGAVSIGSGPAWFTVKFRRSAGSTGGEGAWRWVNDEQGMEDGTLLVNARTSPSHWAGSSQESVDVSIEESDGAVTTEGEEELSGLIRELNPAFRVIPARSQVPGTQLWSLETTASRAGDDDRSGYTDVPIGVPWGDFVRWFALVRIWTPWLAPRHGRTQLQLDRDGVMCSFLSPGGRHLVFLAVSGLRHLLSVFRSDEEGRLALHVRSDSLEDEQATVLVAVGDDFERANAAVMYHARTMMQPWGVEGGEYKENEEKEKEKTEDEPDFQAQWLETWHDGLGFCTWNALGQALSEAKVLAAMDALAGAGIRVGSLIIDDNWQTLDRRGRGDGGADNQFQQGWADFEADPAQFPHGLAHTVRQIRAQHPHVRHVAVWHALLGYWGGVAPGSALAQRYATEVVEREHPRRRNLPIAGPMTVVAAADVRRLYDDFYSFLADAGVDGVKTDAQFMTDAWVSARARRVLAPAYEAAWATAGLRHFQGRTISCMSQTPPLLFRAQLPSARPALPVRNSDDFFPEVPASHPWHVWTNAHNSLLTQHLNVLPDWDMFQTVHDYSGFHAAARCVSGGPIYITDVPGRHDAALLDQIAGPSLAGHAVVFRPDQIGRARDPYAGFHDRVLLSVAAYHGDSSGSGILALFNVSDRPLAELIPLAHVPGVRPSLSASTISSTSATSVTSATLTTSSSSLYIARLHSTGRLTGGQPVRSDALLPISLDVRGYDIITVYQPLSFSFATSDTPLYVANLGLVRKMAAAASVVRTSAARRQSGRPAVELTTSLKALGIVGIYVSALPALTVADNFLVTLRGLPIPPECVAKSASDPYVLEIDAERAWTDLHQTPDWNNEVRLTVHIMLD